MIAASSMRGIPNKAQVLLFCDFIYLFIYFFFFFFFFFFFVQRNSWWEGADGSKILLLKFSNYCGMQFDESSTRLRGRVKKREPLLTQVQTQLDKRKEKDKKENITTL